MKTHWTIELNDGEGKVLATGIEVGIDYAHASDTTKYILCHRLMMSSEHSAAWAHYALLCGKYRDW